MARRKNTHSERGMAMVLTMIMLVVVLGAVLLVSSQAMYAKKQTDTAQNQYQLEEACKAGIDYTIQRIWNQYLAGNNNTAGNWLTYRAFINNIVAAKATATLVSSSSPLVIDAAQGISVSSITISRLDDINGFELTINSTATMGNKTRTAQQTVRVGGSPFSGFDYAVLANNINCILCHAEFHNVDLDNNSTKSLYGTFDRIKVASLQNLMYRSASSDSDNADSRVAGTVYTRGSVINSRDSTSLSNSAITSSMLTTYQFDTSGHVIQNATSGAMSPGTLSVVTGMDSSGAPLTGGNMYKSYPTDKKLMKDALLPTVFPAPYPDDNSDRIVQSSEFHAISDLLTGTATGGIAYGVPAGSTYSGTTFPTASNSAATTLASTGQYTGNLILTGTTANPIKLTGQIAVEGDLLLRGVVKGSGQIFVSGNTYVAGDVTYADGTTFGVAADGTKNALAVITGGNVIIGDYTTIRAKNHSKSTETIPDSTPSTSSTASPAYTSGVGAGEVSIQTRVSSQTISNVPNPSNTSNAKESLQIGYNDPNVTDGNGIVTARGGNQQMSFTQSDLMIFNNLEVAKAVADSNYKPRFYGLNSNAPNNIFCLNNPSEEHSTRYDEGASTAGGTSQTVLTLANYLTKKGYSSSIATRAAYLYLNPAGGWLSDTVLRKMWWDDEQSRTTANSTFKFDGLLYSNNAIFTIVRSKIRHGSNTEGRLRVRGSIICPDIGVLAAGNSSMISSGNNSLLVQYDKRVKDFWAPQDRSTVTFQRDVYDLLPQAG